MKKLWLRAHEPRQCEQKGMAEVVAQRAQLTGDGG